MKGNNCQERRQKIEDKLIALCDRERDKQAKKDLQKESKAHWPLTLFEQLKFKRPDVAWRLGLMAGRFLKR